MGEDVDIQQLMQTAPIRIPHPRECLPRRPARTPAWEPRRDRRDAGRPPLPRHALEGWHSPRIVSGADLGQMRINFNYRNYFTTAAGYGEKPRRAQYFEGPYETALWRVLEMTTTVVDYQFQPIQMVWETSDGRTVHYTTDAIYATEDGKILVEEVKATQAYFDRSDTRDLLALFEARIEKAGARFIRRTSRRIAEPTYWRTVKDAFDDRRTAYVDADAERATAAVLREGGTAPLGAVLNAVGGPTREAHAKLHAMMVSRKVAIDLSVPPMGDTPVTIPAPPTDPDVLRAFLRRFSVQP
ncbi:hypothetical protein [uncultured Sphingomonas sp.]|uniref:hypothetical protein n=1 Tax=uncultured Sphingomonas sp. TaxID=158754 RepID=UPI0035CAF6BD